ncbi:MAG: 23S rRNA (uracil(1939)-C(5))-methyltransferase RlmD [Clostridium sp.]|nr:23S rRNA (uracil(1939)-C(5))-methyltransferase RlmD [Clostridium sp.]MCM1208291.1 23S rRNA (uracil(1939)-C(5))-methyltransferase RlmD [Ruminococcus sp.]
MIKNDIYEITIDDIGNDGEGIGHVLDRQNGHSFAVFVKDTVIGDQARIRIVKAKKTYAYGRLEELILPSHYRTEAVCDKARRCGGCSLMHMSYEKQLEYKWNKVKSCLERIGGISNAETIMEPVCGMDAPYFYRNKMQLPVGRDKDGNIVIGFYAGRTHAIINLEKCYIGHEVNDYIIRHVRNWLENVDGRTEIVYNEENHTGLVRHIMTRVGFATGELMVCLVINADRMPKEYEESFVDAVCAAVKEYNGMQSGQVESAGKGIDCDEVTEGDAQGKQVDSASKEMIDCGEVTECDMQGKQVEPASKGIDCDEVAERDTKGKWVDSAGKGIDCDEVTEGGTQGKQVDSASKGMIDCDEATERDMSGKQIRLASICINVNKEKTNKILGDKCVTLYGRDYIEDYIGDILFRISPLSFYQVNPVQTKAIYDKAIEYAGLKGDETVWDMYCGIGTISLSLANKAKKVYGVEIIPAAICDAKENARINHINNVEFFCGKAETVVPEFYQRAGGSDGKHPDVIVVDPPRKGCDAVLLDTIVSMAPDRLVYVSCDPATLARDVKVLSEKGYGLRKAAVFDAFCQSGHVEAVCLLSQKVPA